MPRTVSRKRFRETSIPPYVALIIVVLLVSLIPFWFFHTSSSSSPSTSSSSSITSRVDSTAKRSFGLQPQFHRLENGKYATTTNSREKNNQDHRIAFIIPFIGEGPEAIPPYLELFCSAAAGSSSLADFLLVHNGVLDGYHGESCPTNVHFISFQSMETFAQRLVRVVDRTQDDEILVGSKQKLTSILMKHIIKYPYVLVEFKPALGHIFSDYLEGYSHWGYSDLDIMFGDLERWITPEELTEFDIVTYGFGDQERLYLRGQFTFHKNEDRLNQLWRGCDYLSKMDKRFADVMSGEKKMRFESAEGCYSSIILKQNDIKVKYAVKAFTDVEESDTTNSHGLYVGMGINHDRTVVYKARNKKSGKDLLTVSDIWFESPDTVYGDRSRPLQWETGPRERLEVQDKKDVQCMFWAYPKYQSRLCIDDVKSSDTVFWIDGKLFKQKHETATFPSNVVTAPFFHFQEWKRYYRPSQLATFHRSSGARSFVLCKEGAIPLRPVEEYVYDDKAAMTIASPLGVQLEEWPGIKGNNRSKLPSRSYCLRSGPRKFPPKPPAPQCQMLVSWRDTDIVEILSDAPGWTYKQVTVNSEVTLVLTLQITAEQAADKSVAQGLLDLITLYLNRWQGQPAVLLIDVAGATPEVISMLKVRLGSGSNLSFGLDACLIAAIFRKDSKFVSRKALLNMVIDAAPTRWVISGFELERGIVISHDTAVFAHRTSHVYEDMPGNMFIIPQFAYGDIVRADGEEDENLFTIRALWNAKQKGNLKKLHGIEEEKCAGQEPVKDNDLFEAVNKMWWDVSEPLLGGGGTAMDHDKTLTQRALELDDIQLSMINLLTEDQHYNLFAMDLSPILMTDNLSPLGGVTSIELAREVEEFGGKQCYNGLRLAQMAAFGYNVNVMAGAFAASTVETRKAAYAALSNEGALGSSRCDGCFLFYERHEDILEDISQDERARPAKAALLWDSSNDARKSGKT